MAERTILVADSDPLQRQLIDMLLFPDRFSIVMCEEGREVLEYLRDNTPDAAILNAELPHVSGADICSKIKSVRRLSGIPVVLITPDKNDDRATSVREFARLAKADLVIQKPLGDKNLRERLGALLEGERPQTEIPTGDTQVIERALLSLEGPNDKKALEEENRLLRAQLEEQAERLKKLEARYRDLREKLKEEESKPRGLFGRRRS